MSLINCPECGAERVSSLAAACPHCGFPVAEYLKKEEEEKQNQKLQEQQEQEALERKNSGKLTVTYRCADDVHKVLRVLSEGRVMAQVKKGTTEEIPCEGPMTLFCYINDEVYEVFHVEPGYDYVVEIHLYTNKKPDLTCTVQTR